MITGEEYLGSLEDGRLVFVNGREVPSVPKAAEFASALAWVARTYDRYRALAPQGPSPVMTGPRSTAELREKIELLRGADRTANTTFSCLMTLLTLADDLAAGLPERAEYMQAYFDEMLRTDRRIVECITDAKGDRTLPPSQQPDPDAYTRVVARRSDGIVIRGAKLHITGAPVGHELLVMPTKRMKENEADYAVVCAIPVGTPGVRIISSSYAPATGEDRHYPLSRRDALPDGLVIFDDVFVPHHRVFLDGETAYSARFAHGLGLWERIGGAAQLADDADLLAGLAQLVAQANGLTRVDHIKEKIADIAIYATMVRAGLESALAHVGVTEQGFVYPDALYTNAAKYYGAANYPLMVRNLHDIAGGSVVTAPTLADLDNPAEHDDVAKYLQGASAMASEDRLRVFHTIRDLTADTYGGWRAVTNIQSGGGLFAQRLVTRRHFDMDRALERARAASGLT